MDAPPSRGMTGKRTAEADTYASLPWQCLYFFPEPQGQAALRATLPQVAGLLRSMVPLACRTCARAAAAAGAGPSARSPPAPASPLAASAPLSPQLSGSPPG